MKDFFQSFQDPPRMTPLTMVACFKTPSQMSKTNTVRDCVRHDIFRTVEEVVVKMHVADFRKLT